MQHRKLWNIWRSGGSLHNKEMVAKMVKKLNIPGKIKIINDNAIFSLSQEHLIRKYGNILTKKDLYGLLIDNKKTYPYMIVIDDSGDTYYVPVNKLTHDLPTKDILKLIKLSIELKKSHNCAGTRTVAYMNLQWRIHANGNGRYENKS